MTNQELFQWNPIKKLSFRFIFIYLVLFNFSFLLNVLPFGYLSKTYSNICQTVVQWVGKYAFNLNITIITNGSGDTTHDYVLIFCFLSFSVMLAFIWTLADRNRSNYSQLYQWLKFLVRLSLASFLIVYGAVKIIPVQFMTPTLHQLAIPFGNSSPMGLLWKFMGMSSAYTIFTGIAEMSGGILLLFPRLATLGALISMGIFTNVFLLNMSYDVPVKILSFHLLLMSLFIVFDDIQRLMNFFILNRPVAPANLKPLSSSPLFNKSIMAFQAIFGVWLIFNSLSHSYEAAKTYGFLAEKSPFYGIWPVDEFIVNGESKPQLFTDDSRWHQMIFDDPGYIAVQKMNGSFETFKVDLNQDNKTIKLSKHNNPTWSSELNVEINAPEKMILEGLVDGHQVKAVMHRKNETEFELINRGFHWINEHPYNR